VVNNEETAKLKKSILEHILSSDQNVIMEHSEGTMVVTPSASVNFKGGLKAPKSLVTHVYNFPPFPLSPKDYESKIVEIQNSLVDVTRVGRNITIDYS